MSLRVSISLLIVNLMLVIVILIGISAPAFAKKPQAKPLLTFGWRHEFLDTLSANADLDEKYDFGSLRLRFGLDLVWERVTIHALGQAAGTYSLPANGSFGIGRTYFTASGGQDTSPGQTGLAELSVQLKPITNLSLTAGRIVIKEGVETLSGDARFDWIKRARLSERLVGTWDWVTVGRRFDGASVTVNETTWNLSGYGARVLQGGVDFNNAFKQLDGVDVFGAVFTSKKDQWVPSSELRLFNHLYRDSRPTTKADLGDRLLINTLGASLVGIYPKGPGTVDVMLWLAYQLGDYGTASHSAIGFITEVGYGWPEAAGAPWIRAGLARASGDKAPGDGDHGTFFNMAPTNHKFYGYQDLNAFQNLNNFYGQVRFRPHAKIGMTLDAHLFRLSHTADAWYGGSGPANNEAFGYVARRPPSLDELDSDIGTEVDFTADWSTHPRASIQFGASHFRGGDLARVIFPVKHNFTWIYVRTIFNW